jgi:hypothetical protein
MVTTSYSTEILEGGNLYTVLPKLWGEVRADRETHQQDTAVKRDRHPSRQFKAVKEGKTLVGSVISEL